MWQGRLGLAPDMTRDEVVSRLDALRGTNRAAALAPYAAHDLSRTESAPFVKAALERSPVSKGALAGLGEGEVVERLRALGGDSIYDGPARLAQPDEVWNFGRGDGLEKCLVAANALGGTEIRIADGAAHLMDGERMLCSFPTSKTAVREPVIPLKY